MKTFNILAFSATVLALMLVAVEGCTPPAPAAKSVMDGPQAPTTQLEKMGAVTMLPNATVVATPRAATTASTAGTRAARSGAVSKAGVHRHHRISKAEKAAYAKAATNSIRAACLRAIVDKKIDLDIRTGIIHDYGNVLTAPVCIVPKGTK